MGQKLTQPVAWHKDANRSVVQRLTLARCMMSHESRKHRNRRIQPSMKPSKLAYIKGITTCINWKQTSLESHSQPDDRQLL